MSAPRNEDMEPYMPQKTYQEEDDERWERENFGNSLHEPKSYEDEQNGQWGIGGI